MQMLPKCSAILS